MHSFDLLRHLSHGTVPEHFNLLYLQNLHLAVVSNKKSDVKSIGVLTLSELVAHLKVACDPSMGAHSSNPCQQTARLETIG